MLLKCKKCGVQIEIPDNASFAECKNCGERQIISNPFGAADNERIETLYQKALVSLNKAQTENECLTAKSQFEILIAYKDSQQKIEECERKLTECTYNTAVAMLQKATAPIQFADAKAKFSSLGNYKDSIQMVRECDRKYEIARKDDLYNAAVSLINESSDISELELALMQLDSIIGHRDAREQVQKCREKIDKLKHPSNKNVTDEADNAPKGMSRIKIAVIAAAALAIVGGIIAAVCVLL